MGVVNDAVQYRIAEGGIGELGGASRGSSLAWSASSIATMFRTLVKETWLRMLGYECTVAVRRLERTRRRYRQARGRRRR
jgi:hypothetical protein